MRRRSPGRPTGVRDRQSASYQAALLCATHGLTDREAAERFGIHPVTVHLTRMRHFRNVRAPLRPFPEDELSL